MDAESVKRKYRRNARFYERVLDLGCGTGLSLPLLREGVGDSGRVYGVELSNEMRARALGFEPYAVMRRLVKDFQVEERLLGSHYLAWGSSGV